MSACRPSILAVLVLLTSYSATPLVAAPLVQGERPNVLMFVVDDLNDWVVGLGGNEQSRTPHIDRLAKRGLRFTNAHCNYALCNPSRASVLTGFLPSTNGVWGNFQDWRKSQPLAGKPTLPEMFKRAGYYTGAAGKIFHANHGGPEGALTGGHGGRMGFNHPASWTERYPSKAVQIPDLVVRTGQDWNGLDIWHWDWGPLDHPDSATADGRCAGWINEQLKRNHDRPFFLALGVYAPHGPWYAPRRYFDAHPLEGIVRPEVLEHDLDDVPDVAKGFVRNNGGLHGTVTRAGLWEEAVRAYLAQITFADATIGGVLDVLDASPYAENTIVVLWSDHGWYLGEKQRWHKGGLWEEATRVPFLIVAPGVTRPGSSTVRAVSLVDLYPTLLDLCDLLPRKDLDGASLVPLMRDPAAKWERVAVTCAGGGEQASYAVRDERWRYIRYHDGSEELYDHAADPHEWTNLAGRAEHAEVKQGLAKAMPTSFAASSQPIGRTRVHESTDGRTFYDLRDGDEWPVGVSPRLVGANVDLYGDLVIEYPEGVIAARGDEREGWAFLLKEGRPTFVRRQAGKLHVVTAERRFPSDGGVRVRWTAKGAVTLFVGEEEVGRGTVPPITVEPKAGLTVGLPTKVLPEEWRIVGIPPGLESLVLAVEPAKGR